MTTTISPRKHTSVACPFCGEELLWKNAREVFSFASSGRFCDEATCANSHSAYHRDLNGFGPAEWVAALDDDNYLRPFDPQSYEAEQR